MLRTLKALVVLLSSIVFSAYAALESTSQNIKHLDKVAAKVASKTMDLNLPYGVTPVSHKIYELHMAIFWISILVAVMVFGVMFYSIVKHRKSRGVTPSKFHGSLAIEVVWTIIPALILVVMAIPATRVLMEMEDASKPDVNIKITGFQWYWRYDYLDDGIGFYSKMSTPQAQINNKEAKSKWYLLEVDNPLVVPTNRKIRFLITSKDVNHSWWVRELGVKKDALPGFIHAAWARIEKPGIYRGQCTELCGMLHGYMPIVVIAKTPEEYAKWLAHKKHPNSPVGRGVQDNGEEPDDSSPSLVKGEEGSEIDSENLQSSEKIGVRANNLGPANAGENVQSQPWVHINNQAISRGGGFGLYKVSSVMAASNSAGDMQAKLDTRTMTEQMVAGKKIFGKICVKCHMKNGQGMPHAYPSLVASKIVTGPQDSHIRTLLYGHEGTQMRAFKDILSYQEIADVITYVRNSWDNNDQDIFGPQAGGRVGAADVARVYKADLENSSEEVI